MALIITVNSINIAYMGFSIIEYWLQLIGSYCNVIVGLSRDDSGPTMTFCNQRVTCCDVFAISLSLQCHRVANFSWVQFMKEPPAVLLSHLHRSIQMLMDFRQPSIVLRVLLLGAGRREERSYDHRHLRWWI